METILHNDSFDGLSWVLERTGASGLQQSQRLQSLWGGYGELLRLSLLGSDLNSVILKRVLFPDANRSSASDRRKRRSYEVEQVWYNGAARRLGDHCRVARLIGTQSYPGGSLLLLEDLGESGFSPHRPSQETQLQKGLQWLANFHATFLGETVEGLWSQGSYWHLKTRHDEWSRMPEGPLKSAAESFDKALCEAKHLTVVHGDAKPANFCWHEDGTAAAVDFQYVGSGCGMRDVAYYLDCLLGETGCSGRAQGWLDIYFQELFYALKDRGRETAFPAVEAEWRSLYPIAWSDFQRFYQGWGRGGTLGPYSRQQLELALNSIEKKHTL